MACKIFKSDISFSIFIPILYWVALRYEKETCFKMLMGIFGIDKRCLSLAPQSVPVLEILRWMRVGSPDTNIYQIQIRSMLFLQTKIIMENTGKRTNQSKTATTLSCSWELTVQIPFEATESSGHVLDMILLLKWFSKSSTKQLL